jgi:glycerol-3-phosphate acyltransferase PlsX
MTEPRIAPVAVDAMGGDFAPEAVVQGAVNAARNGHPVVLVGDEQKIRAALDGLRAGSGLPLTVRHASEAVEMHDHPGQAMRRKKDNSIRVCFELMKSGEACGMVSAGNSGAVMAGAIFILGRVEGVERPAIISVLPALSGHPLMLDMGANVECKPLHLVQFALMGEVYSRRVLGVARPKVAILANGEEESKGTDLTRTAAAALRNAPIDFRGYCEGRDLLTGELDVIVTDGFTGNVFLKTTEGTAALIDAYMVEAISSLPEDVREQVMPALARVRERMDWETYGGAQLLGIKGSALIAHGSSSRRAIRNALVMARDSAEANLPARIANALR